MFSLPIAFVLVKVFDMSLYGIWLGMILAPLSITIGYMIVFLRVDWHKSSEKAIAIAFQENATKVTSNENNQDDIELGNDNALLENDDQNLIKQVDNKIDIEEDQNSTQIRSDTRLN